MIFLDAVMTRPPRTPIGLELARSARTVGRAFDEALSAAGGSLPVWLVLLNLELRARTPPSASSPNRSASRRRR